MSITSMIAELPPWLLLGVALGVLATVASALAFVAGELFVDGSDDDGGRTISGEERRTREIRAYLDAIGERYREGESIDGHDVDFFLPERSVAITFDAATFFGLEDADVHPILCEYEMPAAQLGSRLPFETPGMGGTAERVGPVSPETEAAFRELGLPPGAEPQRVRSAYRRRVKSVHPDHGGDQEAFKRVQEAYATAREYAEQAS